MSSIYQKQNEIHIILGHKSFGYFISNNRVTFLYVPLIMNTLYLTEFMMN